MRQNLAFLISIGILFLFAANYSHGQHATIVLKDSTRLETEIIAFNKTSIFISGRQFRLSEIASLFFTNRLEAGESLIDVLIIGKTPFFFDGMRRKTPIVEPANQPADDSIAPIIKMPITEATEIDQLYASLDKFRLQRVRGKGLMILSGFIGGATYLLSKADKIKPRTSSTLYTVGSLTYAAGFTLDLFAGKHLKRKHKK